MPSSQNNDKNYPAELWLTRAGSTGPFEQKFLEEKASETPFSPKLLSGNGYPRHAWFSYTGSRIITVPME